MIKKMILFFLIVFFAFPLIVGCSTYTASDITKPDENGNAIVLGWKATHYLFGTAMEPRQWRVNVKNKKIEQFELEVR